MATDGHGLRDLIIRHGWTRIFDQGQSDQRSSGTLFFALENSVYSVSIRAKIKNERWRMNLT